ncbi:PREDICTED: serine/threonine-protein kinase AFC3-like isoform X1 [Camelina sativa]|uniref:Serine/threonine-protein kinase AFC3-like isoform X1 n=2 Tax=Camelina sativa TaxID=90675 RepID=A0ABM0UWH1_CAMSA|nr:PREDICTED: serine/threonine-protein kinase AFC3-like isoform X1 [Camelina sativa]
MVAANNGFEKMDQERVRKRPRMTWDEAPPEPEAKRAVIRGHGSDGRVLSPPLREDDRDGHYVFTLRENLTPRYKILSKMGEGTFGRVLECWDRDTKEYVAIKIIRSIKKYRDAAMIEIDVLQKLLKSDKGRTRCVQMKNWFDYRNHICIVFEKLGPSLFDFLKRNKYSAFPLALVRDFGCQLLESVAYMHELQLVHTDLKPENILLVSSENVKLPDNKRSASNETHFRCLPKSSAIKLIDFGSTVCDNRIHHSIVQTRHYRSPEVILGLGWSYQCDLWSVGCILFELCTGEALFQTHDNLEHLAMMERALGPLPEHMTRKACRGAEKYFRRGSRLNWPEGANSRESIRAVKRLDRLKDMVSKHVDNTRSRFADLLYGLLTYDPSERLTANEALDHPFLKS